MSVPTDADSVTEGDLPDSVDFGQQSPTPPAGPRVVREAALDWVKFDARIARDGSIDPVAKALYAALASFADSRDRGTDPDPQGLDIPTRSTLAACIGMSVDSVDRYMKRLEEIGVVRVERRRDPNNPRSHLPSVYVLLDHEWWDDRAAVRAAARRAESRPGGSRTDAARGSRTDAARGSRTGAAVPLSVEKEFKNPPHTPRGERAAGAVPRPRDGGGFSKDNPNHGTDALVAEVLAIRGGWTETAVRSALDHPNVAKRDPEVIRRALLILAADKANTIAPGRLPLDGHWWKDAEKAAGRSSAPEPRTPCADSRCDPVTRRLFSETGQPLGLCPTCNPTTAPGGERNV